MVRRANRKPKGRPTREQRKIILIAAEGINKTEQTYFSEFNRMQDEYVYENIVLPVQLDGNSIDEQYINEVIDTLGLRDKRNSLPTQLSGGQQQRVAIARALAGRPAIILADEPTGNLDSATSQDVLSLLRITADRFSQTIMMITHNEEIAQLADRIIRIEDGRIASERRGGEEHE